MILSFLSSCRRMSIRHNSSYFLRQSDFSISSYNTVTYGKHSLRYLGPTGYGRNYLQMLDMQKL